MHCSRHSAFAFVWTGARSSDSARQAVQFLSRPGKDGLQQRALLQELQSASAVLPPAEHIADRFRPTGLESFPEQVTSSRITLGAKI